MTMGRKLIMHGDANGHQSQRISMGKGASFEEAASSSSLCPPFSSPLPLLPSPSSPPPSDLGKPQSLTRGNISWGAGALSEEERAL